VECVRRPEPAAGGLVRPPAGGGKPDQEQKGR
jgi:hypothetical protein